MTDKWTPDKMITLSRAAHVARLLFPGEYHVLDCRNEIGREGHPCRVCAAANLHWAEKVNEVRAAMFDAFGDAKYAQATRNLIPAAEYGVDGERELATA